jgi:hypothetical protein
MNTVEMQQASLQEPGTPAAARQRCDLAGDTQSTILSLPKAVRNGPLRSSNSSERDARSGGAAHGEAGKRRSPSKLRDVILAAYIRTLAVAWAMLVLGFAYGFRAAKCCAAPEVSLHAALAIVYGARAHGVPFRCDEHVAEALVPAVYAALAAYYLWKVRQEPGDRGSPVRATTTRHSGPGRPRGPARGPWRRTQGAPLAGMAKSRPARWAIREGGCTSDHFSLDNLFQEGPTLPTPERQPGTEAV